MQTSSVTSIVRHLDPASARAGMMRHIGAGGPGITAATTDPRFVALNAAQLRRATAPQQAVQAPVPAPPPAPGATADEPGPLASLMADWGKSGSAWDLDASGTVGIQDMLALLSRMGGQAPQTLPAPPAGTNGANSSQPDPLNGLLADWGKTDSRWDLDQDGTVGIKDMLALLARTREAPQQPPQQLPATPQTGPAPMTITEALGQPQPQQDPLKALQADWGKSGSAWDLNADGTVDIQDMLALLERMSTQKADKAGTDLAATAPATEGDTATKPRSKMEALLADWGKTGSPWDLDKNGTVNVQDLLALLSQMNGPPGMTRVPTGHDPRLLNATMMQKFRAAYGTARTMEPAPMRSVSVTG